MRSASSSTGLRVLMIGSYDIETYARGRIVYKGLLANATTVQLALHKGLRGACRIAMCLMRRNYDVILVTGKYNLLLCWLLKPLHRRPIVFDVFISDYDTLVVDRKLVRPGSLKARMLWWGDKISCHVADAIIHDTDEHIEYFSQTFKLPREKFTTIPIGADDEVFRPTSVGHPGFNVLFHGTYIPLQGIEYILKAAHALKGHADIHFKIIGDGQTRKEMDMLAKDLKLTNCTFVGLVPAEQVSSELGHADVALGIFGMTPKASRVIPNKAYEIMACGKALITADTPSSRRILADGRNAVLVPAGDPPAIAKAILKLHDDSSSRDRIAREGHALYEERFTPARIGLQLRSLLLNIGSNA